MTAVKPRRPITEAELRADHNRVVLLRLCKLFCQLAGDRRDARRWFVRMKRLLWVPA